MRNIVLNFNLCETTYLHVYSAFDKDPELFDRHIHIPVDNIEGRDGIASVDSSHRTPLHLALALNMEEAAKV